jgi:acetyl-CoA carboxylase biotin carboxyl carrier protein
MKPTMRPSGRVHTPELEAIAAGARGDRAMIELRAPMPGIFVPRIAQGDLVTAGSAIGELVVLGRAITLVAPRSTGATGATGATAATGIAVRLTSAASRAVGYGDLLVAIDPSPSPSLSLGAPATSDAVAAAQPAVDGLVFRAPTSGRFYGRPAPDKPPFVTPGAPLSRGVTICLLEVMKTFHRVTYGGPGLPDTARIRQVLVADGDDVNAGDPLLALE